MEPKLIKDIFCEIKNSTNLISDLLRKAKNMSIILNEPESTMFQLSKSLDRRSREISRLVIMTDLCESPYAEKTVQSS
jgi:hypothetical protein